MKNYYERRRSRGRPVVVGTPVRKVVTKRTKRVVGYLSSVKMDTMVPWESQLEYDYACLLEVDNTVVGFYAQPERLEYQFQERNRRYVPDFRVECRDNVTRVVEVKYQADADDADNQELFTLFRGIYARRGIQYDVVTEPTIRRKPRLPNAKLMLNFRDHAPDERLVLRFREALAGLRETSLGDLESAVGLCPERRGWMYGAAIRGHLDIDIDSAPLSSDSRVSAPVNGGPSQ